MEQYNLHNSIQQDEIQIRLYSYYLQCELQRMSIATQQQGYSYPHYLQAAFQAQHNQQRQQNTTLSYPFNQRLLYSYYDQLTTYQQMTQPINQINIGNTFHQFNYNVTNTDEQIPSIQRNPSAPREEGLRRERTVSPLRKVNEEVQKDVALKNKRDKDKEKEKSEQQLLKKKRRRVIEEDMNYEGRCNDEGIEDIKAKEMKGKETTMINGNKASGNNNNKKEGSKIMKNDGIEEMGNEIKGDLLLKEKENYVQGAIDLKTKNDGENNKINENNDYINSTVNYNNNNHTDKSKKNNTSEPVIEPYETTGVLTRTRRKDTSLLDDTLFNLYNNPLFDLVNNKKHTRKNREENYVTSSNPDDFMKRNFYSKCKEKPKPYITVIPCERLPQIAFNETTTIPNQPSKEANALPVIVSWDYSQYLNANPETPLNEVIQQIKARWPINILPYYDDRGLHFLTLCSYNIQLTIEEIDEWKQRTAFRFYLTKLIEELKDIKSNCN